MIPALPKVSEPKSTIVSMIHQDIREEKPGLVPNVFHVKAGTIENPSITHISAAKHFVYLDGDRGSLPVRDASYEVARSIVEDYSTAQMGISDGVYPGICWFPGELSLKEIKADPELNGLLQAAKIAHQRWLNKLIEMADNDFARYKQHNVVSDFQRKIAEIMHCDPQKHPWMNTDNSLESGICPGCGTSYRPGLVICKHCNYIIDKEKYNKEDFAVK